MPDNAPELRLVRAWLDGWSGIGLIVVGMAHPGFQVSIGEPGAGQWIAVFYSGHGAPRGHGGGHGAGADAVAGGAADGVEGDEQGGY